MSAKNHIIKIRISAEMKKLIEDISKATGFHQTKITRWLLHRSLEQYKADSVKGELEFSLKEIQRINQ